MASLQPTTLVPGDPYSKSDKRPDRLYWSIPGRDRSSAAYRQLRKEVDQKGMFGIVSNSQVDLYLGAHPQGMVPAWRDSTADAQVENTQVSILLYFWISR